MNKLSNHQRSHLPKTLVGSSPCEPTQRNELSNGNMAWIVIWAFHVHKAQLCPQWDRRWRFAAFGFSGFPACTWFPHVSTAVCILSKRRGLQSHHERTSHVNGQVIPTCLIPMVYESIDPTMSDLSCISSYEYVNMRSSCAQYGRSCIRIMRHHATLSSQHTGCCQWCIFSSFTRGAIPFTTQSCSKTTKEPSWFAWVLLWQCVPSSL
jgi:hypothetical protein